MHRTAIAAEVNVFALQLLRDQIDRYVYPVHRLDRKTSGVLIFALTKEYASLMQKVLTNELTQKKYMAIVRGYFNTSTIVDHPLTNDRGKTQEAVTHFQAVSTSELNIPFGKYLTSRYSLIEAYPKTGRMHQIRKHLNHLRHPIIGDRPHGCNKQNRLFLEKWNMKTMLLHAASLSFSHPNDGKKIIIEAKPSTVFTRMQNELSLVY